MKKLLSLSVILFSFQAFADATEDAMILNQEMQFLEESAKTGVVPSRSEVTETEKKPSTSLERTYFGDEADTVRTRTAAPKRRALTP